MIKIAWENKGARHSLACHENVKTSSNRIGKTHTRVQAHTHTQSPRPPTHGYAFLCLSISLSTLLAYSSALSIPRSNSSSLTSIPRLSGRTWLLLEAATAFFIYLFSCLRAIVLKAQQTMRWTNGRLAFV